MSQERKARRERRRIKALTLAITAATTVARPPEHQGPATIWCPPLKTPHDPGMPKPSTRKLSQTMGELDGPGSYEAARQSGQWIRVAPSLRNI
jgi:hypothetical protein